MEDVEPQQFQSVLKESRTLWNDLPYYGIKGPGMRSNIIRLKNK